MWSRGVSEGESSRQRGQTGKGFSWACMAPRTGLNRALCSAARLLLDLLKMETGQKHLLCARHHHADSSFSNWEPEGGKLLPRQQPPHPPVFNTLSLMLVEGLDHSRSSNNNINL